LQQELKSAKKQFAIGVSIAGGALVAGHVAAKMFQRYYDKQLTNSIERMMADKLKRSIITL